MGDPKKLKKKYETPAHPWNKNNIEVEAKIRKEYGLVKKKEIHIASSFLKKYKDIAKKLLAKKTLQGEKEKEQVLAKLQRYGLLPAGANIDQVLGLEMKDLLERRIQSIVCRKGLARSMKQARQFIIHRHIRVGQKEVSRPSYLVPLSEESFITFKENSTLASAEHPERVVLEKKPKVERKEVQRRTDRGGKREFNRGFKKEFKTQVKAVVAERNENKAEPKSEALK